MIFVLFAKANTGYATYYLEIIYTSLKYTFKLALLHNIANK